MKILYIHSNNSRKRQRWTITTNVLVFCKQQMCMATHTFAGNVKMFENLMHLKINTGKTNINEFPHTKKNSIVYNQAYLSIKSK